MDNTEQKTLIADKNRQIQVIVQNPDLDEDTIDLGKVFLNMKQLSRIYAWVIVLCVVIGLCTPLLIYQFTKDPLTVSSVVSLHYNVSNKPVTDLTAPDGSALDLSQITSSYVLQNAMNGIKLSQPVTLKNLRDNIRVVRILTEESRQQQEVASKMVGDKNTNAYTQVQKIDLKYENKFIVSLTNGFGEEDSRMKHYLKDSELRVVLDRILSAYNMYLVKTYSQLVLPNDEISVINIEELDFLDSLDLLRTAVDNLYDYCDGQTEEIKAYRSWRTGKTLTDWMNTLETIREASVNYLYSYVYNASLVKDYAMVTTDYQYKLRNAETQLDIIKSNIATNQTILDNYKNDEIFVTMQESDSTRSTQTTTDYYNNLILQQAKNYAQLATLEERIADLKDKIESIDENNATTSENIVEAEEVDRELNEVVASIYAIYEGINDNMKEVIESPISTIYTESSAAQGKTVNFLVASAKKMAIGAAAGLVIACGLWFLSALAPEFLGKSITEQKDKAGKEAARA